MATIRVFPGVGGSSLRHPSAGPIKTTGRGSLWPSDSFTHRRIADGSLVIEVSGGGIGGDVGTARRHIIDRVIERGDK